MLTHEHARRLVERGHRVTLFVGAVKGQPRTEIIDGVEVIRAGGPVTTRLHALRWYRAHRRKVQFDVVVEEINTLPYFAPWFAAAPVVLWMHQLAREVWWYEAPRPLAAVGFLLERSYLRLYRKKPALVLSASTRQDLLELGFGADHVQIVPPAIERWRCGGGTCPIRSTGCWSTLVGSPPRNGSTTSLRPWRGCVESGIEARLEIVGGGEPSAQCGGRAGRAQPRSRGPRRFLRIRSTSKRSEISWHAAALIVMASAREGWGLAITEANAVGTPAVVYDRPGLRDSTIHERTGLLTSPNPEALARRHHPRSDRARALRAPAGRAPSSGHVSSHGSGRVTLSNAHCSRLSALRVARYRERDLNRAAPSVSVVIPTLNAARYLEECLASVRAQDYAGRVEVVIVDAGSTDETLDIAGRFEVERILENPLKTGEAGKAVGLRAAEGDLHAQSRLGQRRRRLGLASANGRAVLRSGRDVGPAAAMGLPPRRITSSLAGRR